MLKKIKVYESFIDYNTPYPHKETIQIDDPREIIFNSNYIKKIEILKIGKKIVWQLFLETIDGEILYTAPFKY